jgi:RNA polymerase sigma factor (TIGR02999 family)
MDAQHEITEQLVALRRSDDPTAWDRLVPLVYSELRAIAHRQLHRERDYHTLSTTALVHEAYLKLVDQRHVDWHDRAHFFAIAATVMRRVLIDSARRRSRAKRVSVHELVPIGATVETFENGRRSEVELVATERADVLVALDEALTRLAVLDERLVRVVECRFFGGLTEEETAIALGVTARTVRRDWFKAKGWLKRDLEE